MYHLTKTDKLSSEISLLLIELGDHFITPYHILHSTLELQNLRCQLTSYDQGTLCIFILSLKDRFLLNGLPGSTVSIPVRPTKCIIP